jgi:hypothetical protein
MRVQLVDLVDAASQLRISSQTIRRMIKEGLPCVRVHRRVLLDQHIVEQVSREGFPFGVPIQEGRRGQ